MTLGNSVSKFIVAVGCVCLLSMGGCYLGDPGPAHGAVAAALPPPANGATLSVKDTEVQEALKLIDGVLVSNGHPRDHEPLPPEDRARGLVASYGICGVTLKDDTVVVGCVEPRATEFGPPFRKTMGELQDALARRYGKANVSVEE